MKINAVLPCAGRGERAGLGFNKTLALLGEKPVALVSAEQFAALPEVTRIVVVCGKGEEEDFRRALSPLADKTVFVTGGETRTASVAAGIAACEEDCEIIAVHDGARPYLSQALLRRTYDFAQPTPLLGCGGAVLDTAAAVLAWQGQKIPLTKNENRILQVLLEHKGKVVERDTLMTRLWETDSYVDENTLTVNVARLRKKLEAAGLHDFIQTQKGVGYKVGGTV